MVPLTEIKKQLAACDERIAQLEKSYHAILEFIDKIEDLFQFQDRVEISYENTQIWPVFVDEIRALTTVEVCALFLVDENTREFKLKSVLPEDQGEICNQEISSQIECGIFPWIVKRRRPALIPSLVYKSKKTIIMLPLSTLKRTLGMVLILTPIEESAITQENLKLLTLLSKQYSLMMENALLYENLRQENEYLQKAQAQIVQAEKLTALGRLTAGAFHEILNPLNIISGHAQLLSRDNDLSPRVSKYMNIMQEQAQRIAKIVKGFLLFAGNSPPARKMLKVNELIVKMMSLLEYGMRMENIQIIKDLDRTIPDISGDEEQLSQVFFNLFSNARDAMPSGGQISISTGICVSSGPPPRNGDYVRIAVQDTGCGISEENLSKIFDPFFTTTQGGGNPGLGLSVSYGIIQEHGGFITADSTMNAGTKFTVFLPFKT
jgi:signal transduction histidine kinase